MSLTTATETIHDPHTSVAPAVTAPPVDQNKVRRAAWAGLIGTTLEQYDFVIYGTASSLKSPETRDRNLMTPEDAVDEARQPVPVDEAQQPVAVV